MKRIAYEISDLDKVDAAILTGLVQNARISMADLSRQVRLSAPSVAERVKRLEEAGIITGYHANIAPAAIGLPISAWLRIRPVPGEMQRVAKIIQGIPEVTQCDRVTGEDCFLARVHLASVADLERVLDLIVPHAMTHTSIIQSSPVEQRLPPLPE